MFTVEKVPLLVPIGSPIRIPALSSWVIIERELQCSSGSREHRFGYIGSEFKKFFYGQPEKATPEMWVQIARLERPSNPGAILSELGDFRLTISAILYLLCSERRHFNQEGLTTFFCRFAGRGRKGERMVDVSVNPSQIICNPISHGQDSSAGTMKAGRYIFVPSDPTRVNRSPAPS